MKVGTKYKFGQFDLFIGKFGLTLFHPKFDTGKSYIGGIGIFFPTLLTIRPRVNWTWDWAGAFEILGFGFGLSFNHCDGPDYEYRRNEQPFGIKYDPSKESSNPS